MNILVIACVTNSDMKSVEGPGQSSDLVYPEVKTLV